MRVRVLLDDHGIIGRDTAIARLSAHPNIEIRAFNPFRNRRRPWTDFFTDWSRVNRRAHNKVMVADNAIMIVGGRNIADHYFGVHGESNYRDLDIVAAGPVVRDASVVFDDFWNSTYAVPYEAFVKEPPTRADADAQVAEGRARMAREPLPFPIDEETGRHHGGHGGHPRPGSAGRRCESSTTPPRRSTTRPAAGSSTSWTRSSPTPSARS